MDKKRLMLLGGIRYLLPVIKTAHEMGVEVITADYLPGNIAHKYSDKYVNVSILDRDAVLKEAKELRIDGIMSFGVDPGVVTAAYVADKMGLSYPPLESCEILQSKDLFRKFLANNGFNCPAHRGYDNIEHALAGAKSFLYPIIVKPVDSAGSKGVSRVDSIDDLAAALHTAHGESHSGRIIVEQFLEKEGCSSDTDCFSIDDELVFTSFNCQHFDAASPNPYTPSAYTWPSDMPVDAQNKLREELQRLLKLLHMGSWIYNVETRVAKDGKPYIMEVSPRGGGNRLSEVLKIACGQDLIENNIRAALSMPLTPMRPPEYDGYWAEMIVHSNKTGTLVSLDVEPIFKNRYIKDLDLWVDYGDRVEAFSGANHAIGTIVMRFDTQEEALDALAFPGRWLKVNVSERGLSKNR